MIVECPYDGNQITVYVKHSPKISPTKNLKHDDVALFREVYRKVSGNIDIVCQLYIKDKDSQNLKGY